MKNWLDFFADIVDKCITSLLVLPAGSLSSLQAGLFFVHRKKLYAD